MKGTAKWIRPEKDFGDVCPVFQKSFAAKDKLQSAVLHITAQGTYMVHINGRRVGERVMAPGWTSYGIRLQYQAYDVKALLTEQNQMAVTVGKGWYRSPLSSTEKSFHAAAVKLPAGLWAQLELCYEDGSREMLGTDETWSCFESCVRFSEIYDGEILDATHVPGAHLTVQAFEGPGDTLIPDEGEWVTETEYLFPAQILTTPKGERVVDFGQNLTGYAMITVSAKEGEEIRLSHAEVLDKEGNFYTDNYRAAKAKYQCICTEGHNTYRPLLAFYGFRYLRVEAFPGGILAAKPEHFTAAVVRSKVKQTIQFHCSNGKVNQLFRNVLWGQKGNFLDIPTDCPQRDERLGWTGDAQVFMKTSCYNYDVKEFWHKWLRDMQADQLDDGSIPRVIPATVVDTDHVSAAWGDAATICPWILYLMYGDQNLLSEAFDMMCRYVDYITAVTKDPYLWTGGEHFGDWLGLDAPSGSYKGASRDDFIATAFYAYSTSLVIKAGKVLGKSVEAYEKLYDGILHAFQSRFTTYETQTECVLAAQFGLARDKQAAADRLAALIRDCGGCLQTGFVGTPYLLHVLSDYGYQELAYDLLLREEYPSWLYQVAQGATTMWEHWDGIRPDGSFWNKEMNSFNHYAYGAVADWLYGQAAGIKPMEEAPGFKKVRIHPHPDRRLDWLQVSFDSPYGRISSGWWKAEGRWRLEVEAPVEMEVWIGGMVRKLSAGTYTFYLPIK